LRNEAKEDTSSSSDYSSDEKEELGAPEDAIELRIEHHGGVYYSYRKDTEQFMGQDTDLEKLITAINDRTGLNVWARKPEQSNQTTC
jgi:hypothetical protein